MDHLNAQIRLNRTENLFDLIQAGGDVLPADRIGYRVEIGAGKCNPMAKIPLTAGGDAGMIEVAQRFRRPAGQSAEVSADRWC